MRNGQIFFGIIFSFILLLIDIYAYRGLKKLLIDMSSKLRKVIKILFWLVPIIILTSFIFIPFVRDLINPAEFLIYFHFISGSIILFYVPKLIFIVFNFIDDLSHGAIKLFSWFRKKESKSKDLPKITRSQFLTRAGIIIAGIPFLSIAYGIGWGRFDLKVRREKIFFDNLPLKFQGFKVAQISDFHLGSLLNSYNFVEVVVETVNSLNPDLILFTGDMVNNVSEEMDKFILVLSKLKAKYGKYSILGNHDYGDYVRWESEQEKFNNLNNLKQKQVKAGFDLLLNESRKIKVDDEEITLIGIENWGLPPFPQYGDLAKAMTNVRKGEFKILMSHDPTHWDEQVLGFTDIDLTLSGHTHGAQFGIEIPGWRWSPVNMRYKRWGGLYTEDEQHLYVNTGVGFIGFPGRVGMPPEVTLIELENS